jgi:hypothetical protein
MCSTVQHRGLRVREHQSIGKGDDGGAAWPAALASF